MRFQILSPAVLSLVLCPALSWAQLSGPLTGSATNAPARAQAGTSVPGAGATLRAAPATAAIPGPATESATQAVNRAWSGDGPMPTTDQPSVQTPPVALVETDDAHYPDPRFSTPAHPWLVQTQVGSATEALMQAQADGTHAGPLLPTLGAPAGLSYQRYLKSFTLPLPATFAKTVETDK